MGCVAAKPLQKVGTSGSYRERQSLMIRSEPTRSHVFSGRKDVVLNWEFDQEIARGSHSRIYRVINTETNDVCAAKVYDKSLLLGRTLGKSEPPFYAVQREIEILAAAEHEFVVPIVDVIEDDVTNSLLLVCPLADHGTLHAFMSTDGPLSERTLQCCFRQVAQAMAHIHSLNIVHRDLRLEKVLVFSETCFKVGGFSEACALFADDEILSGTRGAVEYLAPEERNGAMFLPKPADVWAYGVTLYAAAFGRLPEAKPDVPPQASDRLRSLLQMVLDRDPMNRPTFEAILESEWLKNDEDVCI